MDRAEDAAPVVSEPARAERSQTGASSRSATQRRSSRGSGVAERSQDTVASQANRAEPSTASRPTGTAGAQPVVTAAEPAPRAAKRSRRVSQPVTETAVAAPVILDLPVAAPVRPQVADKKRTEDLLGSVLDSLPEPAPAARKASKSRRVTTSAITGAVRTDDAASD